MMLQSGRQNNDEIVLSQALWRASAGVQRLPRVTRERALQTVTRRLSVRRSARADTAQLSVRTCPDMLARLCQATSLPDKDMGHRPSPTGLWAHAGGTLPLPLSHCVRARSRRRVNDISLFFRKEGGAAVDGRALY